MQAISLSPHWPWRIVVMTPQLTMSTGSTSRRMPLERRFQPIWVPEPSLQESLEILRSQEKV